MFGFGIGINVSWPDFFCAPFNQRQGDEGRFSRNSPPVRIRFLAIWYRWLLRYSHCMSSLTTLTPTSTSRVGPGGRIPGGVDWPVHK
jgi:hypothetical protein